MSSSSTTASNHCMPTFHHTTVYNGCVSSDPQLYCCVSSDPQWYCCVSSHPQLYCCVSSDPQWYCCVSSDPQFIAVSVLTLSGIAVSVLTLSGIAVSVLTLSSIAVLVLTQMVVNGGPELLDELCLATHCPLGTCITTRGYLLPAHSKSMELS